ncbi:MAG: DUF4304 domain-containing protein, partial [Clostridiales bacterium]|nr:DUF4304 domain-containing protein [Clostridiales bacterium]
MYTTIIAKADTCLEITTEEEGHEHSSKAIFLEKLKVDLKAKGYSRKNLNWFKNDGFVTFCLNFQNSQFDRENFFLYVGIIVNKLNPSGESKMVNCHIRDRLGYADTMDGTIKKILDWFELFSTREKIIEAYQNDKLPDFVRNT